MYQLHTYTYIIYILVVLFITKEDFMLGHFSVLPVVFLKVLKNIK